MEPLVYNGVSLLLFLLEIVGSILIPNVAILFDFISVISLSSIMYIFPGMFYYMCNKKFGNQQDGFKSTISIVYVIGGILMAVFILLNTLSHLAV